MAQRQSILELAPFNYTPHDENCEAEWKAWVRSFEWYLKANHVKRPDDKFCKLLHLAGPKVQQVFDVLPTPLSVTAVPRGPLASGFVPQLNNYEVALAKLNEFFAPRRNSTYERHVFRQLKQDKEERIAGFALRLRVQAAKCNFGNGFEDQIKDQIIQACESDNLRRELLKLGDVGLEEILQTAKIHESIQEHMKSFEGTKGSIESKDFVNKIYSRSNDQEADIECTRCGYKGHTSSETKCPAKGKICNKCGGRNHFSKRCRTKQRYRNQNAALSRFDPKVNRQRYRPDTFDQPAKKPKHDEAETVKLIDRSKEEYVFAISQSTGNTLECKIGGVRVSAVIDSGSKYNIIDRVTWKYLKSNNVLVRNQVKGCGQNFKAYGNYPLEIIGTFEAKIETKYNSCWAEFYVVENDGRVLIGHQSGIPLGVMKIGENVNQVAGSSTATKIKGFVVDIPINKEIKPVAQPYRRIPVPLEKAVDEKIDELLSQGIIEKVNEPSPWISPVVPVPKADGVRICIDMRRANEAVARETYPLPTMEDFLPHIGEGKYFTKLDVANAFHQVEISEDSRQITTFITKRGLYRYTRLMFGIACAPELFQKIMEQILIDCPGCLNYMDDIIIYGKTKEQLEERVEKVLKKLKQYNVVLNKSKCIFGVSELEFLGHKLSAAGISPTQNKVEAIQGFRRPLNAEEVRSFLGLVNFVGKFIPDLATITEPLRKLTRKEITFTWTQEQNTAFETLKGRLSNKLILGYYNVQDKTQVYADASPVGLGAVLVQINEKGPRIISYASKSLSDTEKRYCQTEKEALALVWAVERFHFYLFGRSFELITDHKALEVIFSPKSRPCARIERWVLRLQSYKFKVIYRPGKNNIADPLSRLLLINKPDPCSDFGAEDYVNYITRAAAPTAIRLEEIDSLSKTDDQILAVKQGLVSGLWQGNALPFKIFETELCLAGAILLRNSRIVIPQKLRRRTLDLAHEGHPGMTKMKQRLRTKVWWPKIDLEVEAYVKRCHGCTMVAAPPAPQPMSRTELPSEPWQHLAIDFLGPLPSGDYLLVVVDYFSRYIEVEIMKKINAQETIMKLRIIFARFGYPVSITSDNGRQFTSDEFKDYCNEINAKLIYTTPYWPQQNGEVERQNRSILKQLTISQNEGTDWKKDLQNYLHMYRATKHSTTLKTPSELMFGRNIRDKLPNITQPMECDNAEVRDRDKIAKEKGKEYADNRRNAKQSSIKTGDEVWLRTLAKTNKLTPTFDPTPHTVVKRKGAEIVVENNSTKTQYRRNISHATKAPPQHTVGQEMLRSPGEDQSERSGEPRPKRIRQKPPRYLD